MVSIYSLNQSNMYNTITLNPLGFSKKQTTKEIPLFSQKITAGFPSPAEDTIDESLNIHDLIVKNPNSTFFLKVSGDSMTNIGIYEGNILVVDKSITASSGDIVIASINGDFTVKRLLINRQSTPTSPRYYLVPENKNYKPIPITRYTDFEIWGVVTANISQL